MIKEADHSCYICGTKYTGKQSYKLQLHHVNTNSYKHEKPEDVVLLCRRCHSLVEQLLSRKKSIMERFSERLKEVYTKSRN